MGMVRRGMGPTFTPARGFARRRLFLLGVSAWAWGGVAVSAEGRSPDADSDEVQNLRSKMRRLRKRLRGYEGWTGQ